MLWSRRLPTSAQAALCAVLAGIVVVQAGASAEEQLLARGDPAMERAATGLTVLRTLVPHGARILLYDPHAWTASSLRILYRYQAAAYVLTGEANVDLVVDGPGPLTPDPWFVEWAPGHGPTTIQALAYHYDYVLPGPEAADQVPKELHEVWLQANLGLALFKRGGDLVESGGIAALEPVPIMRF
jgi:hypothetical protein